MLSKWIIRYIKRKADKDRLYVLLYQMEQTAAIINDLVMMGDLKNAQVMAGRYQRLAKQVAELRHRIKGGSK